jgi:hypothetical protein
MGHGDGDHRTLDVLYKASTIIKDPSVSHTIKV